MYNGELSAVAKDFMAYVKSAGQAVVADYCVPVKKSETFLSDKSGGTVEIHRQLRSYLSWQRNT